MNKELLNKWRNVMDVPGQAKITGDARKVVATMLENVSSTQGFANSPGIALLTENPITSTDNGVRGGYDVRTNANPANPAPNPNLGNGTAIAGRDALMINMIKRVVPSLMMFDVAGVQPMQGPSGLVFASKWTDELGKDWLNPVDPRTTSIDPANPNLAEYSNPLLTNVGERANSNPNWKEIVLKIARVSAVAETRLFKASVTNELLQDLKAVHGIDGLKNFADAFGGIILHTINRETTDLIKASAINSGAMVLGTFSYDEFFKFYFRLERLAEQIAMDIGKSRGNFVICSPRVASYIASWHHNSINKDIAYNALNVDANPMLTNAANHCYLGMLETGMKVYVDYTASTDYFVVGAKGADAYDAGLFFSPYTIGEELQIANDPSFMNPILHTRARYAITPNPLAAGYDTLVTPAILSGGANKYYRYVSVSGLTDAP